LRIVTGSRLVDDVLRKRQATDMFHVSPDVDSACIWPGRGPPDRG
jgi:hypothetical protein